MQILKNMFYENCNQCSDITVSVLAALLVAFAFKKMLDGKCVIVKVNGSDNIPQTFKEGDQCFSLKKVGVPCK
jgi:hypothetical protein